MSERMYYVLDLVDIRYQHTCSCQRAKRIASVMSHNCGYRTCYKRDMRHKTYEGTYMKQEQLALVRKEHVQKQTLEKSAAGYDSRLSYVTMAYERQK